MKAPTVRAKVSAASSPAVTTSVARGSATKRAATKNGRAEEATPTVASCPESSFAQASSRAPDLASDADSISINMSVPFGKCPTPTNQGQKSGLPPYRQKRQAIRHSPTAPLAYNAKGPWGQSALGLAARHHNLNKPESKCFGRFLSFILISACANSRQESALP